MREFVLVTVGGKFVKIKSPSWDEILAQTNPHTLTLLLQPADSSHMPLTVAEITEAAKQCGLESRCCSLHRRESCIELLDSLPEAVSHNCCVIVEHCHLLLNCHEVLTQLIKVYIEEPQISDHYYKQ